jgi:subtilisin family serine protease
MKSHASLLHVCLSLCVILLLSLISALAVGAAGQSYYVPNEYIIHVQSGTSLSDVEAIVNRMGASIIKQLPLSDTYHIRLGGSSIVRASGTSSKAVKWVIDKIQPNYVYSAFAEPTDPKWDDLWGMEMINMPQAWDTEKGSENITVAVVDSGVAKHPELVSRLVDGYDFIEDESDSSDDVDGHGTHVSGTIAAQGDNGIGVVGVCWDNVKIMPLRVLDDYGAGTSADVVDALAFALENDADVINMSLGTDAGIPGDDATHNQIKKLYNAGIIIVAAAGNEASELPAYPAAFDEVISVSALDKNEQLAYYSNYGSTIDIAAPGGDTSSGTSGGIWSTTVSFSTGEAVYSYDSWQGTSMACPHVAGAAALLLSAGIPTSDVRSRLLTTARVPATGTYDKKKYGAGVLDVAAALSNASIKVLQPGKGGTVGTNPTIKISYSGIDSASIKVYMDYPDIDDNGIPDDLTDTKYVIIDNTNISSYLNSTNKTISGTYYKITGSTLSQGDHQIYVQGNAIIGGGTFTDWAAYTVSAAGFTEGIHLISLPYDFALGKGENLTVSQVPEDLFLNEDGTSVNFTTVNSSRAMLTRWIPKTSSDSFAGYYYYPYNSLAWSNPYAYNSSYGWYTGGGFLGTISGEYAFPAGTGFWIKLEEDALLNTKYVGSVTPINQALNVSLFKGWNMFGNPYDKQVSWGNTLFTYRGVKKTLADAQAAGWVNSNVYYYTQTPTSGYQKLSSRGFLEPYYGYWIYAYVGGIASGDSLVMTILP